MDGIQEGLMRLWFNEGRTLSKDEKESLGQWKREFEKKAARIMVEETQKENPNPAAIAWLESKGFIHLPDAEAANLKNLYSSE